LSGALLFTDIHLVKPDAPRHDIDIEIRNGVLRFLPELQARIPAISTILVGGDVAYDATQNQYAAAAGFLRELQARIGGEPRVLVIPGNHDINRTLAETPDQRHWRSEPKQSTLDENARDRSLRDLLTDKTSGPGLFAPLGSYNTFAATYGCTVTESDPSWHVCLPLNDGYRLDVRGLTSVLLSDSNDDTGEDRLLIGDVQVNDLERRPGCVNVTLCHHPYEWLFDGERQRYRLRHRSALHITGHDHAHKIDIDKETSAVHLRAGALQPKRTDKWDPRLYAIGVHVTEHDGRADAMFTILCARWDRVADNFVLDCTECPIVPMLLAPAGSVATEPDPTTAIARLTELVGELAPADLLTVAAEIGMALADLAGSADYEHPGRVVEHARKTDALPDLWDKTVAHRGGVRNEQNPFP
jgi:calcineurin-like phosphoesterase family protein